MRDERQSRRAENLSLESVLKALLEETRPILRQSPRDISLILSCVHEQAFDPELNVQEIRRRCQLRNNNVLTRFHSLVGRSLHTYLEDLRLQAACRVLELFDLEIYRVAEAVGYQHPETFHRAFRKKFNRTPHQHRRGAESGAEGETTGPNQDPSSGRYIKKKWNSTSQKEDYSPV